MLAVWWLLKAIALAGFLGCASERTTGSLQLIHKVDLFNDRGPVEDTNNSVFLWNLKRTKLLRINMVEFRGEIGLHVHPDADHSLIVVEGTIQLEAGDRIETMTAGDFVSIPRGMPHKYVVQGERAVIVSMDAPYYDPKKTIRLEP